LLRLRKNSRKISVKAKPITELSVKELQTEANRLRTLYASWRQKNPNLQDEALINLFLMIKKELTQRKQPLKKKETLLDIEAKALEEIAKLKPMPLAPETTTFGNPYAPVYPSGKEKGEPLKLDEVEPYFKTFIITAPVVWLVGGIIEHPKEGTPNDVDILISLPDQEELARIVLFRLSRMFPEELRSRLHLLLEEKGYVGPFTDSLPIFRLVLERIPDAEIEKMAEIKLRTKETEQQEIQAQKALKNDRITPGEFWLMTKCLRGYYPGQAQTLDLFLDIYDQHYEYPALSSKKYDGEHIAIHKIDSQVTIHSEDGSLLEKLPNLKSEIKTLKPEICVLEAELENWNYKEKQHYPRESVSTGIEDDMFTANVFDCLYFKGEIPDALDEEINFFDKEGLEKWREKYLTK